MREYYHINGYWKDDKSTFEDYLVTNMDDAENEEEDDNVFFYGLSENDIKEAIEAGEDWGVDFVITSYSGSEVDEEE